MEVLGDVGPEKRLRLAGRAVDVVSDTSAVWFVPIEMQADDRPIRDRLDPTEVDDARQHDLAVGVDGGHAVVRDHHDVDRVA